jgi:hypothetical protein
MTRSTLIAAAGLALTTVAVVQAQETSAPPTSEAPAGENYMRPTEAGVRLTPGMARALARIFVKQGLANHYDMDEEAQKKAAEQITRNIMQLGHKTDRQGARFFEFAFESLVENHGRFTPESGKRWAELSRPMLPSVREFLTGVANDIRPLLPPAKQMQFAGDMMKVSLALDMYEKKMDRWSQGKVSEHEDPFDPDSEEPASASTDPNEPKEVRQARHRAENSMKWESTGRWRQYVDSAISYYKLDEAQKESAESMLREMQDRAKQIQSDEWKAKVLLNRTRVNVSHRGMNLWNTPWMWQLEREYENLLKPINDLTRELQDRLETLPTEPQRQAAAARTAEGFAKLGMKE